jgi:septal ring-binding cell division protein DamX
MKTLNLFVMTTLAAAESYAGVGGDVSRLVDSYIVAKAEGVKPQLTELQVKTQPFTIQVASYINEKDAVSHVEELKLQEKDAMYFPAFVRGQVWFKVCVGRFDKKEDAESYRRQFTKRMDEPFAIVISLLEKPSSETGVATAEKAPNEKVAEQKTAEKTREPASAIAKKASADLPVAETKTEEHGNKMEVKLLPKAAAVAPAMKAAPEVAKAVAVTAPPTALTRAVGAFYAVQVGAYPNEESAKASLAKLPLKDHKAYYQAAVVNGKTWYRLLVGEFSTRQEAEEFQKFFADQVRGAESFIRRMTASE